MNEKADQLRAWEAAGARNVTGALSILQVTLPGSFASVSAGAVILKSPRGYRDRIDWPRDDECCFSSYMRGRCVVRSRTFPVSLSSRYSRRTCLTISLCPANNATSYTVSYA